MGELLERDRAHLIHPFLPGQMPERDIIVGAHGCRLRTADGKEYLDVSGGPWIAQIGHGRSELAEAAAAQMRRLEHFPVGGPFSNDRAIGLAARLAGLAPENLNRVFLTSGGSESNEAAIKMARFYHHRRGEGERTWILSRYSAYHGVAYGSVAATGLPVFKDGFGPFMPHVAHLTPPWPYRTQLYHGQDPTDFLIRELQDTIDRIGPGRIAAMIGEPVMGFAGNLIPPDDYWPRVREVLDRNGILLILDEVVTAFGRLGAWFAADLVDIRADLITVAKGITSGYLPLGGVIVDGRIADVLTGGEAGFPMAYTYGGHAVAAAVALANLDIIEREGLLERAVTAGVVLRRELDDQLGDLLIVGEIRSIGLMQAVELVTSRQTREPPPIHHRNLDRRAARRAPRVPARQRPLPTAHATAGDNGRRHQTDRGSGTSRSRTATPDVYQRPRVAAVHHPRGRQWRADQMSSGDPVAWRPLRRSSRNKEGRGLVCRGRGHARPQGLTPGTRGVRLSRREGMSR